jgi:RNA polymerase sigma factor (sigma-70 family)
MLCLARLLACRMSDVTRILSQIEAGDRLAAEELLPLVYEELRKLAACRLAHENPGQTLQATALVHEAYLRLVGGAAGRELGTEDREEPFPDQDAIPGAGRLSPVAFNSRGHFFAAAAEAMRRILVENARQKASLKRGGALQRLPLDEIATGDANDPAELLALDEALQRLAQADPQAAEILKLRYFAGLSMDEAAQALEISPRTAYYAWQYARSWLKQELQSGESRG